MKILLFINLMFFVAISCKAQRTSNKRSVKLEEACSYIRNDKEFDSLVLGYFNKSIKPSVYDSIVFIEQSNRLHVFENHSSKRGVALLDSLVSADEKNRFMPYFFERG